jgi:D-ribulokinase
MLGAVAAGTFDDLTSAMPQMSCVAHQHRPDAAAQSAHAQRYEAFCLLQNTARAIRSAEAS